MAIYVLSRNRNVSAIKINLSALGVPVKMNFNISELGMYQQNEIKVYNIINIPEEFYSYQRCSISKRRITNNRLYRVTQISV